LHNFLTTCSLVSVLKLHVSTRVLLGEVRIGHILYFI